METRRAIRSNGVIVGWELDSGAVAPTHRTVMNAEEFKLLLTGEEFDDFRLSSSNIVKNTYRRLVDRNDEVDTESQIFATVMSAAVSAGDLSQERADELSLGIPI